jgi:hypothetical protein
LKRYKVIALSVGGTRNKVFRSGEEVNESQFQDGVADQLVGKGFLELISEDKEVPKKMEPQQPQTIEKPKPPTVVEIMSIDNVTRKDMMAFLKTRKIDFEANATKKELYKMWKEEVEKG